MQLSLRWKLIIAIILPLVLLATVVMWITLELVYSHSKLTLHEQSKQLAKDYAARLDAEFQTTAQVARSTAAFLEIQPDLDERKLYQLVRENLRQDPMIYGSAIAFEPYQFTAGKKLFSPYAYRSGGSVKTLDIATESYDYTDGSWEWYSRPRQLGKAIWTEPYFDEGAGNILMVTYSVPFYKEGALRGIATIDIPVETLQKAAGLAKLQEQTTFIISDRGKFVSHPDPAHVMKSIYEDRPGLKGDPAFRAILENILKRGTGLGLIDSSKFTGRSDMGTVWVFYSPIKSTGWSFVTMVPESVMTADVRAQLGRGVIGILVMVLLISISVLLVGSHITRPIRRLADAVSRLGSGNLNAKVENIRSGDEIGQLASGFNCMVDDLNHHINVLSEERAARQSVENELNMAREIQNSLLPQSFPPFPERNEFDLHAINKAAKFVAGDFFDFFFTDENTLIIVIADASGKGIPAALVMAVTRTIIRDLAGTGKSPDRILLEANRLLIESRTQPVFVTVFICSYRVDSGKLIYANAGHHPARRIDKNGNVTAFGEATGTIIGMLEDATYEKSETILNPDESLVLYTDGLPEARSPEGAYFGEKTFSELLAANANTPPRELCEQVINEVMAFQEGELSDDMTLLVLRRKK